MGFFDLKAVCGCCGKTCGLNRFKIKQSNAWICPKCFKNLKNSVGLAKCSELLGSGTIEEITALTNNKSNECQKASKDYSPSVPNRMTESLSFKVTGVTFKTGRKSRQVMLKNMYFNNTPPFDGDITITFKRYDYNGNLAIGVYANDLQIGNVPSKLVNDFDKLWLNKYSADFQIYGSNETNWGCLINVTFIDNP